MVETIIGVVLGWGLARLDRMIGDRQQRQRDAAEAGRKVRRASLRLIAELRAVQNAAVAGMLTRVMPTDVWNRYGDALADDPALWDEWLTVSDAYETIDLANHGDRDPADAVGAASAAETVLRGLVIQLEIDEPPPSGGALGTGLRRLRDRFRRRPAERGDGAPPGPE